MQQTPDAVLFDLDGTLLDTAPDLAAALNRVRAAEGLPPLPYAEIRPHVSNGSVALVTLGFDDAPGSAAFESHRSALLEAYGAAVAEHSRLFAGMDKILTAIESSGRCWGIVTNKPGWLTDPLLDKLGLAQRAACVISGDTTAHAKPHPEPLLVAAQQVGVAPPACLYVGDAERDVAAARAAGMAVVVALYGYLPPGAQPTDWQADGMIDAPADLASWL